MTRALSCDVAGQQCLGLGPARDSQLGGLFRLGNASPMSRCSSEGKISLSEGVAIGAGSPSPAHSMTWSARASSAGGIVNPRALAVLRLMTNSNLVGCSIGSSPGFAPLRILST